MDFYEFVVDTYEDMNYIEVMRCYSGHFERMTRAITNAGSRDSVGFVRHKQNSTKTPRTPRQIVALRVGL